MFPLLAMIPMAMGMKQDKDKATQQAMADVARRNLQKKIAASAQQKLRARLAEEAADG